jgi:phosphoribosyl-AMP cyclohydrolase / phosphoribosyl-ATP pyrophosphohydrolase
MSIPAMDKIKFGPQGLIPAVVQAPGGEVRMVGYMNADALSRTLETGWVTFWSRSRNQLWIKGETSGNRLKFQDIFLDCDGDTLLVIAEPQGPTCHRGTPSCFDGLAPVAWLGHLEATLRERKSGAGPDGSYTQKLFHRGPERIGKKVVEEAGETAIAAMALRFEPTPERRADLINEAADLLFHLQVLLVDQGLGLKDLAEALQARSR